MNAPKITFEYSWIYNQNWKKWIRKYPEFAKEKKAKKAWIYFYKKDAKENRSVRIHIPLHAFHAHIYLKFFGRKMFERELRIMTKYPEYKRSWNIVQKEGYASIIKEFKARISK